MKKKFGEKIFFGGGISIMTVRRCISGARYKLGAHCIVLKLLASMTPKRVSQRVGQQQKIYSKEW